MPRNGRQLVRFLKKNGFIILGYKGSHCKMMNPTTGRYTEVPVHSEELRGKMEKLILKQAGLKGDEK